jgi:hypothetical protein
MQRGIGARLALDLLQGSDWLRIVALDAATQLAGSLEFPLTIPK